LIKSSCAPDSETHRLASAAARDLAEWFLGSVATKFQVRTLTLSSPQFRESADLGLACRRRSLWIQSRVEITKVPGQFSLAHP
jgi:hypothetical protein